MTAKMATEQYFLLNFDAEKYENRFLLQERQIIQWGVNEKFIYYHT